MINNAVKESYKNRNEPIELESNWTKLQPATNNGFSFFQLWRRCKFITSDQLTGNACWHAHFARWNDNLYSRVSAAVNGSTTCIYQKTG